MKNRDVLDFFSDVQVFLTIEEAETILAGADPKVDGQDAEWNIQKFWDGKAQIRQAIQNYYKEKK